VGFQLWEAQMGWVRRERLRGGGGGGGGGGRRESKQWEEGKEVGKGQLI